VCRPLALCLRRAAPRAEAFELYGLKLWRWPEGQSGQTFFLFRSPPWENYARRRSPVPRIRKVDDARGRGLSARQTATLLKSTSKINLRLPRPRKKSLAAFSGGKRRRPSLAGGKGAQFRFRRPGPNCSTPGLECFRTPRTMREPSAVEEAGDRGQFSAGVTGRRVAGSGINQFRMTKMTSTEYSKAQKNLCQ
jgi:hypothetical protein